MYFLPYYCFVLGLKISAIRYPKNIAAVIPPAAPFIPPVKAPINPSAFTAFIAASAKPFPKLGRGIEAPAPANSTSLSYNPKPPNTAPVVTNITNILAGVNLVVSINI